MHICVSNLTTIVGSDNDSAPGRSQAIMWSNIAVVVIEPLGTDFNEIVIKIHTNKMHLKMSTAKYRSFCLGLNVLSRDVEG